MTNRIVIAAIFAAEAFWSLVGFAQSPDRANTNRHAAVAALEQTLVETISGAEPSVVAISRSTPAAAQQAQLPFTTGDDLILDLRSSNGPETPPPVVAAGVIIDSAGLVLTQYLAIEDGDEHTVTTIDGKSHSASIRAADPRSGLAVLAIDAADSPARAGRGSGPVTTSTADFPALRFGDAEKLRKGQFVVAIGNPFGVVSDGQPTASWGVVTNLARKAPPETNLNHAPGPLNDYRTTLHHLGTLIQTDAKLGWSAGGGALVNLQGELVGLTTTVATIAGHEQPAGYAIPINATMRRIITALKDGHEVEYGMLGISFSTDTRRTDTQPNADFSRRVAVGQVFPGSPADRAGLQTGDVITRVNESPINDSDSLQLAVSVLPPAATASVEYQRGTQLALAPIKLWKLAAVGKVITTVRPESWRGIRVDYPTALEANEFLAAIGSNAYDAKGCVLVVDVEPGSPAAKAGVRKGMFISHVGNQRVATPEEFHAATRNVGEELDIRLTQPADGTPQDLAPNDDIPDRLPNQR
jgi:S1-C subfamily serine protease